MEKLANRIHAYQIHAMNKLNAQQKKELPYVESVLKVWLEMVRLAMLHLVSHLLVFLELSVSTFTMEIICVEAVQVGDGDHEGRHAEEGEDQQLPHPEPVVY